MTKEDIIALGVKEEQATKIVEAYKAELQNYVAKSEYDLLSTQNKNLDYQVKEHAKQLDLLKKTAGDSEALKKQIADLQTANKKAKDEYADNIKSIRINHAIEKALAEAKAKNLTAVKALLDVDSLEYDDEKDKVLGLQKQLNKLVEGEETKFLFDTPAAPNDGKPDSGIKGSEGKESNSGNNSNGNEGMSIGAQMAALYNAEHAAAPAGENN